MRVNYRKSKNDRECKPRIDSGMERNELWYMSKVSRNGNPVTSSGSSHNRFRDKSVINWRKKKIHSVKSYQYNGLQMRGNECIFLYIAINYIYLGIDAYGHECVLCIHWLVDTYWHYLNICSLCFFHFYFFFFSYYISNRKLCV